MTFRTPQDQEQSRSFHYTMVYTSHLTLTVNSLPTNNRSYRLAYLGGVTHNQRVVAQLVWLKHMVKEQGVLWGMSGNYFFGQIKKPLVSRPTHIFFRDLSKLFLFVKFAGITCFKICVRNGKHIPQFDQCIRNLSGELVITGGRGFTL